MTENAHVLYKVTHVYEPACERGIQWNDPLLGIDWPLSPEQAVLSDRDREWPARAEAEDLFL